jgi:glycyl-tRNA synthetase beta chain
MNHDIKDFLFEIGTEELPAKQLEKLQNSLYTELVAALKQAQLNFDGSVEVFATPRRLAIFVPNLALKQQDQIIERKGPSVASAFDASGMKTKAYEGFLRSFAEGAEAVECTERNTEQGAFIFAKKNVPGKSAKELLPNLIEQVLNALPISKPMHWGSHPQAFLRPVRWIVLLLGDEVVPACFFGLSTQQFTRGNRFMSDEPITITAAKNYPTLLQQVYVMANWAERKNYILHALHQAAEQLHAQVRMNEALLDEVVGLVEYPVILIGNFSADFLSVPNNALIAAMESHQKSFAVLDQAGKLLPHFLIVANLQSKDPSKIIAGNERVIHARLSDAQFFYKKDCATPLENYYAELARVTFQAQLGSLQAKSNALSALAHTLAHIFGDDSSAAKQAGLLAKCDLRTNMVGEFPELQGEMGRIYALKQGLPEEVANALLEQYLPRFANDQLPSSNAGIAVALADKLLNLVGLFGVGQIPTGSKDPFALRRAALGICRIILEKNVSLPLKQILLTTQTIWQEQGVTFTTSDLISQVYDFIIERLRQNYVQQGLSLPELDSVLCLHLDDLCEIHRRIEAVVNFIKLPEAKNVAAANKRARNLLQKENILCEAHAKADPKVFQQPEEQALFSVLTAFQTETQNTMPYIILQKTAQLKKPIDDFFDQVMVMTEDKVLRNNRLALLAQFLECSNQVADISKLVV